jgi:toxin ParE1/3/4
VKEYRVIFRPLARGDLLDLDDYITAQSGTFVSTNYVDRLTIACLSLSIFPERGTRRDDLKPGLRTIGFERRATIAFRVLDHHVEILRIFHGGRDYENILSNSPDE